MEGDVSKMTISELEERIGELEHAYAEFLEGGSDAQQLTRIYRRILELKSELESRRKR